MANFPGTPGDDVLYGTADSDTMTGDAGNDKLWGFEGDDILDGGDDNDILDGGLGADTMTGGAGNDVYVVDNVGDVVTELAGGGSDLVYTTIDYALTADVERLAVYDRSSTYAINLTGNALNNELIGNNGDNILNGGAGADIMQGGFGNDTYIFDNVGDRALEVSGANSGIDTILLDFVTANTIHNNFDLDNRDKVFGQSSGIEQFGVFDAATTNSINILANSLNNTLWGNAGINILDGWLGADTMIGYGGDDYYFVDNAGDVVIEQAGEGIDTVYLGSSTGLSSLLSYTLGDNVERLFASRQDFNYNFTLIGNALDNEIIGNIGNNVLDGGLGADKMQGLGGDDIYVVDNVGDQVIEQASGGTDTVRTSIDYALGNFVENLQVTDAASTTALILRGNSLNNVITGNDGANIIYGGGGGTDTMSGLGGDDIYVLDGAGGTVIEAANGGFDTVYTLTSFTLGANIERLGAFIGSATTALVLTGNEIDNEIWGNDGANTIDGKFGRDVLHGGGGADTFLFSTTLVGEDNVDQLVDFEVGIDRIGLDDAIFSTLSAGALAAGAFVTGTDAADADDRIIYDPTTGWLYYDADGNGAGLKIHFANLHEGLALGASDFFVA